jgi:nucleoside-diphosphate-sugar epimerase
MVYGNFPVATQPERRGIRDGLVTEQTPCEPIGIYGALKFAGEKMVIAYNQVFNLPYTIIRPSALYGERCVSRRVSQIFIESALQGKEIVVQGDGSDRLDFTYVGDLVQGVIRVLENERSRGEIFNLTYGASRSIGELAEILKKHFTAAKVKYVPKDKLTPDRGTLSVDKAKKLIGYSPEFPLERGYLSYIDWYRSAWDSLNPERNTVKKAA